MKTVDDLISDILNREGSKYTNNPSDRGGPTKYGITLKTLYAWRNKPTTANDVMALTESEARSIYRHNYVDAPGYSVLEDGALIEELIDAGVNHGVGSAIRMLQRALKVHEDGSIGTATVAAYKQMDKADVVIRFLGARAHFYADCLDPNKHKTPESKQQAIANRVFAAGWFNRLGEMIERYAESN